MRRIKPSGFVVVALVAVVAVGGYFAIEALSKPKARTAQAPVIPVTQGSVEQKNMPVYVHGIGTVQAFKTVTVKTRVDGQIVKVSFEEGQEVKKGDPLFQIDPRPFQATLDQAMAAKQRDEAQLTGAQLDLDRYSKLIGTGYQSRQTFDQQKTSVDALKGSVAADQAAIDTAKLNLSFADIRAPIDGRTGQRLVDLGNLVQAGQNTSLVTITQVKPIFVNFTVPQDKADEIRRNQAAGALSVVAYASDDQTELAHGKVSLVDNQIDAATGTLRLKAQFDNADERLWPGEFVNARLVLANRAASVTVVQRAVMQGASGYFVYVIKPDNTVSRRVVEIADMQEGQAVIKTGLTPGENVVVDGQYRLIDGSHIKIDAPKPQAEKTPPAAPADSGKPG
ncbi:MAG: efflux RND transporter periplasmic adaptor subunit [Proteobacteria bacterium]|nr:efflux RND transporter periplasmic adaptor subunit [Pseudomonadota bacterium]